MTPTPSATPVNAPAFTSDLWTAVDVPPRIAGDLAEPWFAIASVNERTGGTSNPDTPVPEDELATLYLVNPASGELVEIIDVPASTGDRIFWSPDGQKLLYFVEPMLLDDNSRAGGLYLLNLNVGVSLRLFEIDSLNPRGILDHEPVWSPDSSQFAVVLPTAYATDIYLISADGSTFQNITSHGAYDMWPVWSPDGRWLAFVSDRRTCPTWTPGELDSCAIIDAPVPSSGSLFTLELETGEARLVTDIPVDGPVTWVSNTEVALTAGISDPFAAETEIWVANVLSGEVRNLTDERPGLYLGAAWAPGGVRVLYHRASEPAAVVLKNGDGGVVAERDDYLFSRYGFAADWSSSGEWVAFGGRNAQCPYGIVVARNNLEVAFVGSTPRACDPSYSPDNRWLAYAGIQTRAGAADGRLDLYIGNANGSQARNLTSLLQGEVLLLGWVGAADE